MPGWLGPWELAILLLVVLLVFGPKRLPEAGRSLGRGLREFKNSITGKDEEKEKPVAELTAGTENTQRKPLTSPPSRERDTIG